MGKKWTRYLIAALAGVLLTTGLAPAMPFLEGSELALQNVLKVQDGFGETDAARDLQPAQSTWSLNGQNTFTIVAEGANFKDRNIFGIYSGDRLVDLFEGSSGTNDRRTVDLDTLLAESSGPFGFYLKSPQGWFFSDPAKNADGLQHLVVYEGLGKDLLLGFEDLAGGGDRDFDDLVVRISRTDGVQPAPVPEPATLLLLGSGLLGLAFGRRNRH